MFSATQAQSAAVLKKNTGAGRVGAVLNGGNVTTQAALEILQIEKTITGTLTAGNTVIDVSPLKAKGSLKVIINTVENPFTVISESEIKISAPYPDDEGYTITASTSTKETTVRPHNYLISYPAQILDNSTGRALIDPINIYSNTRGYATDFDPRSLKPVRDNIYYVNPWEGSNANSGLTRALAFKTLAHALALSGDNEIILEPGDYPYVYGTQEVDPEKGITIRCDQGTARLTNKALPRYWREYAGFPGVFECDNVLPDEDFGAVKANLRFFANPGRGTDNIGGYKLGLLVSAAAVTGGGVGWYVGASTTILRMPNNVAPTPENLEIWYAKHNVRITCNDLAPHIVYLENVECWRGLVNSCLIELSHEDSVFVGIKNKYMRALTDDAFECNFYGRCYNWECEASQSYKDGFNYHVNTTEGASGASSVYEIGCVSEFNGLNGNANNGSTIHNALRGVRLNCLHDNSDNRNIQDINSSMSFNVGIKVRNSGQDGYDDIVCGRDGFPEVDPTIMWLLGCEVGEIKVEENAQLYLGPDVLYSTLNVLGQIKNFKP